jgi:hypothetical protein
LRKMEHPDLGTPLPLRGFAADFPFCMDGLRLDPPVGRARKMFGSHGPSELFEIRLGNRSGEQRRYVYFPSRPALAPVAKTKLASKNHSTQGEFAA